MPGTPRYHKDLSVVQMLEGKYDRTVDATGKVIGTLPKGAILLSGLPGAHVATAFDGTAPTFLVGFAADTDAIMSSANVAPATAGIKEIAAATLTTAGLNAPLAADTDVVLTVSEPGDGTEGVVYVTVPFRMSPSVDGNITA